MEKYFGFNDLDDVLSQFKADKSSDTVPTEDELLFAYYGYESYEGSAIVIFQKNGVLYEVTGGHCSCNGLEDQWGPAPVTFEALNLRIDYKDRLVSSIYADHDRDGHEAFIAMIESGLYRPQAALDAYHASEEVKLPEIADPQAALDLLNR